MTRVRPPAAPRILVIETADPVMERALASARRAARGILPVLIEGEAGVGKRRLAGLIHGLGDRARKPFVLVDCSALRWDRARAALFGVHRAGAASTPGLVREAQGGTLYLADVGELPADAQAGLLRLLERGEILPEGATRPERVNVRLIASSVMRLVNLASTGALREDLYYRLATQPIYLPPLRDRPGDVALLAGRFLDRFAAETGKPVAGFSPQAMALLETHDWPGNVRALENAMFRAVALAQGKRLEPIDFPQLLPYAEALNLTQSLPQPSAPVHIDAATPRVKQTEGPAAADRFLNPEGEVTPLAQLERELIVFAIRQYGGRMSRIARALGIGRSTLYRKLRDYGLEGSVAPDPA